MRNNIRKCDKLLLILTLLYTLLGLVMIFSASSVSAVMRYGYSTNYYFLRQLFFSVVGIILGFFFVINFSIKKYRHFISMGFLVLLILLLYVLISGNSVNGAKSWLNIGSFGIQPTEFVKAFIIIYFAIFYGEKINKMKNKWAIFIPIVISIIFFILIILQPDLGGSIILAGLVVMIFFSLPLPKNNMNKILKICAVIGVIGFVILFQFGGKILNENQAKRLQYKNPCSRYIEDTGYQVCNSLISVSNGGLFGLGLGNSTQKYLYLPEAHTDFIFAIVLEELGAIGGLLVIIGYIIILLRLLNIAKHAEFLCGSIIAYGTFSLLILHIFINLMGILGLIPLTGVPLPFLSYGGSFNLVVILLLFLVQRVVIESKNIKRKRELQNM